MSAYLFLMGADSRSLNGIVVAACQNPIKSEEQGDRQNE